MKRIFACDFETTVYEGQVNTEVWSSAMVELNTEDVKIHHSINETMEYLIELNQDCILYYHNLKFDGAFWLDFLMKHTDYQLAFTYFDDEHTKGEWMDDREMPFGSYKYLISNMGQWYTMHIKTPTGYLIDGSNEVSDGGTIVNRYNRTEITATKEWEPDYPEGATVTFRLFRDGASYNYYVILDGAPNDRPTGTSMAGYEAEAWTAKFINLPKYHVVDGELVEYEYTVKETFGVDGYTPSATDPVARFFSSS